MFVSLLLQAHLCSICAFYVLFVYFIPDLPKRHWRDFTERSKKGKKKRKEKGGDGDGGGGAGRDWREGEEYPPPCVWSTLLAPVNANKWESEPAAAMRYSQGHDRHILVSHSSLFCYYPRINNFPRHSSVWLQIQFLISNDGSVQWAQTVAPPPLPLGNMEALKLLQGGRTLFLIHPDQDMTKYRRKKKCLKQKKHPKQTNKKSLHIARWYTKHWPF